MTVRRSTKSAARAEVYLKAADCVAGGWDWYSCNAIDRVSPFRNGPRDDYVEIFDPELVWREPTADQQDIRLLMLCFMAALVEAGDA